MLKKIFYLTTFLLVGTFSFAINAEAEKIGSFDMSAQIGKDGTVNITEYIKYDFEGAERHGIFRDIPLSSKDGPDIAIEVVNVSDDFGDVPFVTSRSGGRLNIKIGDASKFISGVQNYKIDYRLFGAIRFFEGHDEFYWNVTGNDWQIPILSASAEVSADFEFLNGTSSSCYTGPVGATFQNCSFVIGNDMKSVEFSAVGSLTAGNGLTLSVSFPKGVVDPILADKNFSENKKSDSISSFSPFVFLEHIFSFFSFIFYVIFGLALYLIFSGSKKIVSDRRLNGRPTVVQYSPPDGFSLSEIAVVAHRNFRASDFSSVIIKLAVDGYIKIVYPQNKFFNKDNYELVKLKEGEDIQDEVAKKVFNYLFASGSIGSIKINDLDRSEGNKLLIDLNGSIRKNLLNRAIFIKKLWYKLSDTGVDVLWRIFGFAKFLEATEKERLELMNAPELKPEIFEKFLPYAMAFGLETKWAGKFEMIVTAPPSWVEGYPVGRAFSVVAFTQSMNSFGSSVASSSTHSSGGGGGGSSGGGSGGGGGGSW